MSYNPWYTPLVDDEFLQNEYCAIATVAGEFTIGDKIERRTEIDQVQGEIITYYNVNTGDNLTVVPVIGTDIDVCPAAATVEQEVLVDLLATGEQVKFIRRSVIDENGNTQSTIDLELDGTTVYTVAGTVQAIYSRENAGFETIAVTDAAAVTLTVPAGANFAEVTFKSATTGAAFIWNDEATAPAVLNDNSTGYITSKDRQVELQSADELAAFQAISLAGFAGNLEVRYKFDYKARD